MAVKMTRGGGKEVAAKQPPKRKRTRLPATKPGGRATVYREGLAEAAKALCFVGATQAGLAEYFKVSEATIKRWQARYPEFAEALREREAADNRVIGALYKRAMGVNYTETTREVEVFAFDEDGLPVSPRSDRAVTVSRELATVKQVDKMVMPDTPAAVHWLKVRKPDEWNPDAKARDGLDPEEVVRVLNAGRDRVAKMRGVKK